MGGRGVRRVRVDSLNPSLGGLAAPRAPQSPKFPSTTHHTPRGKCPTLRLPWGCWRVEQMIGSAGSLGWGPTGRPNQLHRWRRSNLPSACSRMSHRTLTSLWFELQVRSTLPGLGHFQLQPSGTGAQPCPAQRLDCRFKVHIMTGYLVLIGVAVLYGQHVITAGCFIPFHPIAALPSSKQTPIEPVFSCRAAWHSVAKLARGPCQFPPIPPGSGLHGRTRMHSISYKWLDLVKRIEITLAMPGHDARHWRSACWRLLPSGLQPEILCPEPWDCWLRLSLASVQGGTQRNCSWQEFRFAQTGRSRESRDGKMESGGKYAYW